MAGVLGVIWWRGGVRQSMPIAAPHVLTKAVAMHDGWTDATLGRARRTLADGLATSYDRGFEGGSAFRLVQERKAAG
jgi:hypothetical protein